MTKKLLTRTMLAIVTTALGTSVLMPGPAQAQTPAELPAWLNKVTLGGDLRFRLQHTNDIASTNVDQAAVIRARIAAIANVNESLTVNFRLASGSPTNTVSSSHQTLGETTYNGYQKKPFWLDIASMDYKPFEGLVLTAGKGVNPFYSGGKNELLLDGDVNPEGVNMKYTTELGALKPFAAVAYNVVSDTGGAAGSKQPDLTHVGGQVGAGYKAEAFGATLGAGYHVYNDVKGRGPVGIQASNFRGNTSSGGTYATDFKLMNVEGELNFELGLPITAYGSYIDNSEADTEGTGMLGGLRLGKVAGPGTWSIDYNYRDLGANAIIANFTDGDFGGQTNVYGHRVVAAYVPSPGLTVSAYGIFAERTNDSGATQPWERFNLEVLATF